MSDYQRIIWCPTVVSNAVLFMLVLNLNMVVYQSHVPQNLMSSEWSILELYNIDYRYQKKTQHGY
jgi:ABC-type siderophore export system fused ATPase/permease subunit